MDRQDADDAELLDAVAGGDRASFEQLYRRYAPWLRLKLRYRCADASLVDDIVQEVFVAIWRGKARYQRQDGAEVAGWMWRLASRRLIDALRGDSARSRLRSVWSRLRAQDEPSAEDHVLLGVELGDLGQAIGRLSPDLRAVIQATVLDGLTTREAAVLLGIPTGTVKTRAMRARKLLREELS
jgi:RNA polymerase sigma-70 factor (ECF subfamily)